MSDSTPIGKDIVATFHYTLSDEAGQKLESTEGEDPVTYLHGHGNILPTLETLLVGKKPGETVEATLPPEKPTEFARTTLSNEFPKTPQRHWPLSGR